MRHKKDDTPVIVFTSLVHTTENDERVLAARFEAARQFYNAMLGITRRRLNACRNHPLYIQGKKLLIAFRETPEGKNGECPQEIAELFRDAHIATGYYLHQSEKQGRLNSLEHLCAKKFKSWSWIDEHLDSHVKNSLAKRAYETVEKSRKERTKIHFVRKGQMTCVSGKQATSPLRFEDGKVLWLPPRGSHLPRLALSCIIKEDDVIANTAFGGNEGKPFYCWFFQDHQEES